MENQSEQWPWGEPEKLGAWLKERRGDRRHRGSQTDVAWDILASLAHRYLKLTEALKFDSSVDTMKSLRETRNLLGKVASSSTLIESLAAGTFDDPSLSNEDARLLVHVLGVWRNRISNLELERSKSYSPTLAETLVEIFTPGARRSALPTRADGTVKFLGKLGQVVQGEVFDTDSSIAVSPRALSGGSALLVAVEVDGSELEPYLFAGEIVVFQFVGSPQPNLLSLYLDEDRRLVAAFGEHPSWRWLGNPVHREFSFEPYRGLLGPFTRKPV